MQVNGIGIYNQQTKKSEMGAKKQTFGMAFKPTNTAVSETVLKDRKMTNAALALFRNLKHTAERLFGPNKMVDVIPTIADDGQAKIVIQLSENAITKIKNAKNPLDEAFNPAVMTKEVKGVYDACEKEPYGKLTENVKRSVDRTVIAVNREIDASRSHAKQVATLQSKDLETKPFKENIWILVGKITDPFEEIIMEPIFKLIDSIPKKRSKK